MNEHIAYKKNLPSKLLSLGKKICVSIDLSYTTKMVNIENTSVLLLEGNIREIKELTKTNELDIKNISWINTILKNLALDKCHLKKNDIKYLEKVYEKVNT